MLARALVLLLLTLVASAPQLWMSGWRGTEGRRVQIALEMARNGEWMIPTLGGEATFSKPPLHYWLLGGLSELLGDDPWVLRLPSVLGLFGAALLAMALLRRYFGPAAGWVGALGVLCAPIVVFEWATAEIDPLFAVFTATSLWCLATGVGRNRAGPVLAAGVLGGLALLQKGPPYFVFAIGAYMVWWRRRGFRFALPYFVPLLALPLCYYIPLWLYWVPPGELLAVAEQETLGRIGGFEWRHVSATPLFWLRAVLVQLPFVLWCFWEWRGARDARMDPADLTLRMCSGAAVLAVVILTFFPGRPTRYLLPNVLLFTFAVAPAVAHFAGQQRELGAFSRRVLRCIGIGGAIGLLAMPFFVDRIGIAVAGTMLCAGLAHVLVDTPRRLVGFALLLPLIAGWTLGLDHSLAWQHSPRATGSLGPLLRRELESRGALDDLGSRGHMDSKLLLGAELWIPGDEACRLVETPHWLLSMHGGILGEFPPNYVDRLWLSTPEFVFALHERLPR